MQAMINPLKVYHGTNLFSANLIHQFGIWLNVQRKSTDFGKGFYVTPNKGQALQWANAKSKNPPIIDKILMRFSISEHEYFNHPFTHIPALMKFDLNTYQLSTLNGVIFPLPGDPDWNQHVQSVATFIYNCRNGFSHSYDFIFGPISKSHYYKSKEISFSKRKNQLSLNTIPAIKCLYNLKVFSPFTPSTYLFNT